MTIYTHILNENLSTVLGLQTNYIPELSDQEIKVKPEESMVIGAFRGYKHLPESNQQRSEAMSKLRWWNNGINECRSEVKPDGYMSGRIKGKYEYNLSKEGKDNLGKAGRKTHTPYGVFDTVAEASRNIDYTWDQIKARIVNEKYTEWYH